MLWSSLVEGRWSGSFYSSFSSRLPTFSRDCTMRRNGAG